MYRGPRAAFAKKSPVVASRRLAARGGHHAAPTSLRTNGRDGQGKGPAQAVSARDALDTLKFDVTIDCTRGWCNTMVSVLFGSCAGMLMSTEPAVVLTTSLVTAGTLYCFSVRADGDISPATEPVPPTTSSTPGSSVTAKSKHPTKL
ncbi:orphan protein [Pandoravirus kuranda]|uniref:Orphan protein n=1 Tax=Pandoravirus kuranda TaxID=3019033 RepID=A0AA95EHI0_9VIRU|nr:orphan protein [Pandoravirus kuranda]